MQINQEFELQIYEALNTCIFFKKIDNQITQHKIRVFIFD